MMEEEYLIIKVAHPLSFSSLVRMSHATTRRKIQRLMLIQNVAAHHRSSYCMVYHATTSVNIVV